GPLLPLASVSASSRASGADELLIEPEVSSYRILLPLPSSGAGQPHARSISLSRVAPSHHSVQRKGLMIESRIPRSRNKDHWPPRLASLSERDEPPTESFQVSDTSIDWLTMQILLPTSTAGFCQTPSRIRQKDKTDLTFR